MNPLPPCDHYEPPSRPAGTSKKIAGDYVFVTHHYDLGDSKDDNDQGRYRSFGYDLDHTCTNTRSEGSCKPEIGALDALDGPDGRDHSANEAAFAALRAPVSTPGQVTEGGVTPAYGLLSALATHEAEIGFSTMVMRLRDYNSEVNDDQVRLDVMSGSLWSDPSGGPAPRWDTQDHWHTSSLWLTEQDGAFSNDNPRYFDLAAYVSSDVLVAHFDTLGLGGIFVNGILLRKAIITARLARPRGDDAALEMSDVVLAGRWPINNYLVVQAYTQAPGMPMMCQDPTYYPAIRTGACARQDLNLASDDGTAPCDALSIVYDFDAVAAELDDPIKVILPPLDPCMPLDCAGKELPPLW